MLLIEATKLQRGSSSPYEVVDESPRRNTWQDAQRLEILVRLKKKLVTPANVMYSNGYEERAKVPVRKQLLCQDLVGPASVKGSPHILEAGTRSLYCYSIERLKASPPQLYIAFKQRLVAENHIKTRLLSNIPTLSARGGSTNLAIVRGGCPHGIPLVDLVRLRALSRSCMAVILAPTTSLKFLSGKHG